MPNYKNSVHVSCLNAEFWCFFLVYVSPSSPGVRRQTWSHPNRAKQRPLESVIEFCSLSPYCSVFVLRHMMKFEFRWIFWRTHDRIFASIKVISMYHSTDIFALEILFVKNIVSVMFSRIPNNCRKWKVTKPNKRGDVYFFIFNFKANVLPNGGRWLLWWLFSRLPPKLKPAKCAV